MSLPALAGSLRTISIVRDLTERERAQRELEANAMLRVIFDHAPWGISLRGLDGRYLHLNASVAGALGAAPHELVGREPSEHHDPAAAALIRAQDEEMLRTGRPLTHDQRVRHADGSEHDYLVVRYPVRDDQGRVSGFGALSLDVSDSRRTERELLDAERRFRMLLEAAPDPIVIVDVDGLIVLVNTRTEELFGFAREELLGQRVEMLMPAAARGTHLDQRRRYAASPYFRQLDVIGLRKDGSEFPAQMTLSGLATESGVLIVSALRDITALKRAERERAQALAELHEAQHIAQLGSWRWNLGAGKRVWSAGMYELYGADPAAGPLDAEQSFVFVHPDDLGRVKAAHTRVLAGGEGFELDYRLISAVRGLRMMHAIARPDPEEPGCYRGTLQDVTALHESEQALRESEQALRERTDALAAVIDSAPIGMAVTLPGGRFEHVNQALCELLGYSSQELSGMTFSDVTHPDDLAAGVAQHKLALARELTDGQLQRRYLHRDGRTVWARVSFAAVGEAGVAARYIIYQIQDITAERAAAETIARLAAVVSSSHEAIIAKTLDGVITDWNPAAERMYGYLAHEAIGMPISMLLASESQQAELDEILQRVCDGSAVETVTTRRHKDQRVIDVELTISPIHGPHGGIVGASTVGRNITDRKRTQEALRRSQERLEQAETVAGMGSWEWNLETDRVSWSAGLYKIFELEPETADMDIEHGLRDRVHPEDRELMRGALGRAASALASVSIEFRAIRADGHVRILDWRADPLVDDTGKPVRVIGVVHDITNTKRTQQALSAASSNLAKYVQELQQLAAGTSANDDTEPLQAALSARQLEVLHLVAEGLTNDEIGKRLFISAGTVKWHIKQILTKTNSANRAEAVARVLGADRRDTSGRDPT